MRLLGLAAVGLLLLAGCTQAPAGSPGPAAHVPSPHALPLDLKAPTVRPELRLGRGDGEPNIAVDGNGTIYITPIGELYVSTDGGKSFAARGEPGCVFPFGLAGTPCPPGQEEVVAPTDGHGDGDIAIDARGCLHWLGLGAGIPHQVSCDQGRTFSKAEDISNGTGSDREWIDTAGAQVAASWRDGAGYVSRVSTDNGITWGPKVLVDKSSFLGGPVIHDPTHPARLWIPGVLGDEVDLFTSEDQGATWSSQKAMALPNGPGDVVQSTQIFPVAAADDAGNLYLVVSTKQPVGPVPTQPVPKQGSLYGIYLTTSSDRGKTWSTPRLLSTPMKDGVMPFITAGARGRIAVVWYENVVGLPDDVLPDEWNVKLYEGLDQLNATGPHTVAQLNGQPNHIGGLCSNGLACVAGGDRCLLDYFEVALDLAGQPVVTWADCIAGTGANVAAQGTFVSFGGVQDGTPLR